MNCFVNVIHVLLKSVNRVRRICCGFSSTVNRRHLLVDPAYVGPDLQFLCRKSQTIPTSHEFSAGFAGAKQKSDTKWVGWAGTIVDDEEGRQSLREALTPLVTTHDNN